MPTVGAPRTHLNKFKFQVQIDGVRHAAFVTCSEIAVEVGKIEYREGGVLVAQKTPGLLSFPDVELERGAVATDTDFYDWLRQVADASRDGGVGDLDPLYKRTVDIVELDRNNRPIRRTRLINAWPVKFKRGEWDNNSEEITMEGLTLSYDYFTPLPV